MTKIYRVKEINKYGDEKELAFFSSFKKAVAYIKAQFPKDARVNGVKGFIDKKWVHDVNRMEETLKDGYKWGQMFNNTMFDSYAIDIITLEKQNKGVDNPPIICYNSLIKRKEIKNYGKMVCSWISIWNGGNVFYG